MTKKKEDILKMDNFIRLATLEAHKVTPKNEQRYHTIFRLGSVIFKKNRVINIGRNYIRKTHPKSNTRFKSIHAEFNAIIGCSRLDLDGASILVVRVMGDGSLGMAKPCDPCMNLIRAARIKNLYYSNEIGGIRKERVR